MEWWQFFCVWEKGNGLVVQDRRCSRRLWHDPFQHPQQHLNQPQKVSQKDAPASVNKTTKHFLGWYAQAGYLLFGGTQRYDANGAKFTRVKRGDGTGSWTYAAPTPSAANAKSTILVDGLAEPEIGIGQE